MEDLMNLDDLYLEFCTSYFPPAKRERIERRLAAAGKLCLGAKKKLTPLERIQETFEQEAHVLNKTVFVDDGSEKKVYSTCVFENVKRYNCNICVLSLYGKTALIRHNCSKKHNHMLKRSTHPHQNFDDHQIINLDPGMKTLSMSDCYIVRDLLEKCPKFGITLVLIGLEYLVEVHNPREPYYHCLLCDKVSTDIENTLNHLESIEHRMLYLLLFFPKVYKKLLLLKRGIRMIQLQNVVGKIEKKLGRLKPWRHEGKLSLKQKRAIRHSIDSGPHLRDNPDLSFAEDIVFNDKVKNQKIADTAITEFIVNESEESVMEIYERQKGGIFRCRLCRMSVNSPLERITHPYTGKHFEKTVSGINIYDSVTCQIESVLYSFPQPLIGTEYVVEYDEQGVYMYHCMLCRKAMNNHDMVTSHLVSKAHRQRYIKHHMPRKDEELLKLSGPVRAEEIEKLLKHIEAKFGRLPPFGCLFSLEHQVDSKRTVKDLISQKIMDGKHFTIDEQGIPRTIKEMPVPLFPKEGQVAAPAQTKSKKKKKHRDRSSSRSPQRRTSHSSSSRSLSSLTLELNRRCSLANPRLSPVPGPSTSHLPQEIMPPPENLPREVLVQNWLYSSTNSRENTESQAMVLIGQAMAQHTEESIREFFSLCDEDNWEQNVHDCCPGLSINIPLREVLMNDEFFYALRRFFTVTWVNEKFVHERGWSVDDLDLAKPRFRNIHKVMVTGRLCPEMCRPSCRNLVESVIHCVLADFPETKEMTEEEIVISCRGIVNMSNWMHLLWSSIPKPT